MRLMIHSINARDPEKDSAMMYITIGVNSLDHLQYVINRLLQIDGVERVERAIG